MEDSITNRKSHSTWLLPIQEIQLGNRESTCPDLLETTPHFQLWHTSLQNLRLTKIQIDIHFQVILLTLRSECLKKGFLGCKFSSEMETRTCQKTF